MFNKPDMSAFMGESVAHRGYFDNEAGVPENSLTSFEAAIEKGFVMELDIQLSSDGVAMVFHDADLERVCGVQGKIWDYTMAELKEMKLFGTEETIPTFEETLDLFDGRVPLLMQYSALTPGHFCGTKRTHHRLRAGSLLKSSGRTKNMRAMHCILCLHICWRMWQHAPILSVTRQSMRIIFP